MYGYWSFYKRLNKTELSQKHTSCQFESKNYGIMELYHHSKINKELETKEKIFTIMDNFEKFSRNLRQFGLIQLYLLFQNVYEPSKTAIL